MRAVDSVKQDSEEILVWDEGSCWSSSRWRFWLADWSEIGIPFREWDSILNRDGAVWFGIEIMVWDAKSSLNERWRFWSGLMNLGCLGLRWGHWTGIEKQIWDWYSGLVCWNSSLTWRFYFESEILVGLICKKIRFFSLYFSLPLLCFLSSLILPIQKFKR